MNNTEKTALYTRIDELCAENEKLREYVTKLKQTNIVLDSDNCELKNDIGDMQFFIDENRKLRRLAVLQSVIFKHMSTCPTTDCQVCPVKEECAEFVHLEGVLGIDDKKASWLVQWRNEDAADQVNRNECRIEHYPQYGEDCVGCSVCGYVADRYVFEEANSCPNCGRKVIW